MRVLTYNVQLRSNLSYAHTFRRIIANTKDVEWFYGEYGRTGIPYVDEELNVHLTPCPIKPPKEPIELDKILPNVKPELLFMHEDPQWLFWCKNIKGIPKILWLPWDNHELPHNDIKRIVNDFDLVIPVSKMGELTLRNGGIDVLPNIYNPIDIDMYKPTTENLPKLRSMMNISEDEYVITWVGRPGWRKRFMHIVEIASRVRKELNNVKLVLITDMTDPSLQWNPLEIIHSCDMSEHTAFPADLAFNVGLPPEFIRDVYNLTDVYIAPHGGEGMGMPIAEAMACETPFVATDYTTTSEFANYKDDLWGERGVGAKIDRFISDRGIDRPYVDIQDFADKVVTLLEDKKKRKSMGVEGRKWVVENASNQKVASQLENIFKLTTQVDSV